MHNSEEVMNMASELQSQALANAPWYADFDVVMNIFVFVFLVVGIICGFVTMAIAEENGRGKGTAFIAGLFLGILGIMIYAIRGESIELRVAIEERERRKLQSKLKRTSS